MLSFDGATMTILVEFKRMRIYDLQSMLAEKRS